MPPDQLEAALLLLALPCLPPRYKVRGFSDGEPGHDVTLRFDPSPAQLQGQTPKGNGQEWGTEGANREKQELKKKGTINRAPRSLFASKAAKSTRQGEARGGAGERKARAADHSPRRSAGDSLFLPLIGGGFHHGERIRRRSREAAEGEKPPCARIRCGPMC